MLAKAGPSGDQKPDQVEIWISIFWCYRKTIEKCKIVEIQRALSKLQELKYYTVTKVGKN